MQLFGLKNCENCRKALKALPNATLVDVRADGVPPEVLAAAYDRFGAALINTRSTTWRGLDATERDVPALQLLVAHPTLMKRPLIVVNDQMHLGWTPQVQAALTDG